MRKLLISILLSLCACYSFSQTKIEKETRIKSSLIPKNAINYIDSLSLKKVKWYKETNTNSYSYEAKFKYNKQLYSIEFDSLGNLSDIEVNVKLKMLAQNAQKAICNKLDSVFEKCKIIKIQKQYKANAHVLLNFMNNMNNSLNVTGYEIIVKGKENGKYNLFELFFTGEVLLEKKSVIILKNTDHLDF